MLGPWSDVGSMHREFAEIDVRYDQTPLPRLIAFDGDAPLVTVTLRPFDKGQYMDPLIEVLSFLLPFGATRISAGFPGRSWSLNDPIPPVTDGVDLRQRTLVETRAVEDGTLSSCLHPFEVDGDRITWGDPLHLGAPEGPISSVLAICMPRRHELRAAPDAVLEQLARIGVRGHEIAVAPAGAQRLERLALVVDPDEHEWQIDFAD